MSHVIPLHIFHTLKSGRWNCNVCRRSRKMTELNYVRNLAGGGVAAHGHRSLAIRALRRPPRQWGLLCDMPEWFPSNVARNSPLHISDFELQPLELQRLWAISKNDRVKLRATFGRDPPTTHEPFPRPGLTHPDYPKMSHVIPLQIFQILKSDRWNCNVCGPSRKMTELNYVRLLLGRLPPSLSIPTTDHANRDQDWLQRTPSPRTATITRICRARRPAPTGPYRTHPTRP